MADDALTGVVTDASVIIKWFCEEEHTDRALYLRELHIQGKSQIAIPDLSLYEIANALRYNKSIHENEIREAVESMYKIGIDIIIPTKEVIQKAIHLALKYNITVYDSYYLALAEVLGFVLITADKNLYTKIEEKKHIMLIGDIGMNERNGKEESKE